MPPRNYLAIGTRFVRLTVFSAPILDPDHTRYLCLCDCGTILVVQGGNLKSGNTKSCGCLKDERLVEKATTHGGSYTRLYYVWHTMRQRCVNPKNISYPRYGARGITVCPEWRHFAPFQTWALANGYQQGLTIDRIDNDGPYTPENCRWVTPLVQRHNRRDTRLQAHG